MDKQTTDAHNLLRRIPKAEMEHFVASYIRYADKMKYLRYIILGMMSVILGYNLFIARNYFPINQFNSYKLIAAGIMMLFVIGLIVLGVIMVKSVRSLKKALKESARKHQVNEKEFIKVFHHFVKAAIGGPGLK